MSVDELKTMKTLQNQELLAQVGRAVTAYLNVKNAGGKQ
jgi:hypothetical protein